MRFKRIARFWFFKEGLMELMGRMGRKNEHINF
jgi:hypothetical protein